MHLIFASMYAQMCFSFIDTVVYGNYYVLIVKTLCFWVYIMQTKQCALSKTIGRASLLYTIDCSTQIL